MKKTELIRMIKSSNPDFNFRSYDLKILDEKELATLVNLHGSAFKNTLKTIIEQAGLRMDTAV